MKLRLAEAGAALKRTARETRTSNVRLVLVRDARLLVRQSRGQHQTHTDVVKEVRSLKHTYMSIVKRKLMFTELC